METKWLSNDYAQEELILAGDVGGTNTNLAIVGRTGDRFTIIVEYVFKSTEITDFSKPVQQVLDNAIKTDSRLNPAFCCISAAGPVANNYCQLTNCDWAVDGADIKAKTKLETLVINDFMAVGYGIPTLDVNDPAQITALTGTDGSTPQQSGTTKAVVGAGTGLGVGYLTAVDGKYTAYPSEGGHSGFAPFDEESHGLAAYLMGQYGMAPGTEPLVSGQGITNAFKYLVQEERIPLEGILKQIDATPDEDKPNLISVNADSNAVCKRIIQLMVRMYARFASSIALIFLPTGGLYLAGGIAAKNEKHFLEEKLFMKYFEMNYNSNISPLLKKIPVYIIQDYSISLYGAANAACSLIKPSSRT